MSDSMFQSFKIHLKLKTMWTYTTTIMSGKQRRKHENQWSTGNNPKWYLKNDKIWKIESALMLTWLTIWSLEIRNKKDLSQVTKYLKLNETVQACVSDIFWWVTF